jgi:probable LLM family oxidoreductase
MSVDIVLGLDTFGDVPLGGDGTPVSQATALRNIVAQGVLADEVGVDVFALGEHHRDDMPASAPDVVLSAVAARTERVRVSSAVTVLSSDDPVRVFQRYATLDALSDGRAEVILGRGSSIESFPLFGYDLDDYERLFEEKLDLFAALRSSPRVTWSGTTRPALRDQLVVPRPERELPTWVGVGGSPESVVRAAKHGFALMLAIIGGPVARFAPLAALYVEALARRDLPPLPIGIHAPGHVARTDEEAKEQFWPFYAELMARVGAERGWAAPDRRRFEAEIQHGALFVGSPETVARKIAATLEAVGATRFDLKYGMGGLSHEALMQNIELYGTRVAPLVREQVGATSLAR